MFIQNFAYTSYRSPGQNDIYKNHRYHHKRRKNLRYIGKKTYKFAGFHRTEDDHFSAEPENSNNC